MTRRGRRVAWLALGLAIALASYGGVRWHKLSHYPAWHASVQLGDDCAAVIRKMGPPDMIRQRPEWLYCTEARCASEFMYGHSLPPEWWVVGFDAQGRVIWKEALQSP